MKQSSITSFFTRKNNKPETTSNGESKNGSIATNGSASTSSKRTRDDSSNENSPENKKKSSVAKPKPLTSSENIFKILSTPQVILEEGKTNISLDQNETVDGNQNMSSDDYDPTVSKYDPIKNATWARGQSVPYIALTRTLDSIENVSSRLRIVEILSNFFRSVIVQTPDDLLPSLYLCLNKLAPAYEGLELGIAETNLMKAIGSSTGRSLAQIKADCQTLGDIGLVAEQSRTNQRMLYQPARLTVRGVFEKLKEIAKLTGHASQMKKVEKIQQMFVACKSSEARFLIRSLAGKLRIGLAEQSVLQALALACTLTPPNQEYPPKIKDRSKNMSGEDFKEELDKNALILKTTYW